MAPGSRCDWPRLCLLKARPRQRRIFYNWPRTSAGLIRICGSRSVGGVNARIDFKASDPAWSEMAPHHPTSPHWYDEARLRRLMGAYIARDQDHGRDPRTVREFISEFRGLSGSAKQKLVLDEFGAARLSLPDFFGDGDRVNNDRDCQAAWCHAAPKSAGKAERSWLHWQGSSRRQI